MMFSVGQAFKCSLKRSNLSQHHFGDYDAGWTNYRFLNQCSACLHTTALPELTLDGSSLWNSQQTAPLAAGQHGDHHYHYLLLRAVPATPLSTSVKLKPAKPLLSGGAELDMDAVWDSYCSRDWAPDKTLLIPVAHAACALVPNWLAPRPTL